MMTMSGWLRDRIGLALLAPLAVLVAGCATSSGYKLSDREFADVETAMLGHIEVLASEEFEGRRPGTRGEDLTLDYLQRELEQIGFVSGTNDPGHPWRAPVPMVSTMPLDSRIKFAHRGRFTTLEPQASAAFTTARRALVGEAELIFVGYAKQEVAPGELSGRVALILSEPGESPARRAALFANGAAAVVTAVSSEDTVAQIRASVARENLLLASEEDASLAGFATHDALAGVFGRTRWEQWTEAAERDDFTPFVTDFKATVEASSLRREFDSHNLIGRLPGSNPDAGAILLLGHWDHFGVCRGEEAPDRLCNGAVDNASGMAAILELASRLASRGPFERDIYVLGTTAEEWGLLGARAFVESPSLPLDEIVAAFNFDTVALAERGAPVGFIGEGRTRLDSIILDHIAQAERAVGDRQIAAQFLSRQDGWALLQAGVPTVLLSSAIGQAELVQSYLATDYHQPSDEVDKVTLGGAVDDVLLHEMIIATLLDPARYP